MKKMEKEFILKIIWEKVAYNNYSVSISEKKKEIYILLFKKAKNKIYLVENFRKVTNDGGWNYNIKTGEIHANLPYNFFEQGIDWQNY